MSEYKPITGKLRNSMTHHITTAPNGVSTASIDTVEFDNLCDAVDSIHEALEAENERLRGEWDYWESTHVKLPKDADGEYIHFGDVLDQFGTPMTVFAMSDPDPDQGDCMLELITDGISDSMWVRARKMRHYHDPTVVDVLHELVGKAQMLSCIDDEDKLVADFAKRLTLAGDAE